MSQTKKTSKTKTQTNSNTKTGHRPPLSSATASLPPSVPSFVRVNGASGMTTYLMTPTCRG